MRQRLGRVARKQALQSTREQVAVLEREAAAEQQLGRRGHEQPVEDGHRVGEVLGLPGRPGGGGGVAGRDDVVVGVDGREQRGVEGEDAQAERAEDAPRGEAAARALGELQPQQPGDERRELEEGRVERAAQPQLASCRVMCYPL